MNHPAPQLCLQFIRRTRWTSIFVKRFRQAFPPSVFVRYGQAFSSAPNDCPLRPAGRIPASCRNQPLSPFSTLPTCAAVRAGARGIEPCAVAVACPSGARAPRRGVAPAAVPLTFRSASLSLSQAEPPTARGRAACAAGLTTPTGAFATPGTRGLAGAACGGRRLRPSRDAVPGASPAAPCGRRACRARPERASAFVLYAFQSPATPRARLSPAAAPAAPFARARRARRPEPASPR